MELSIAQLTQVCGSQNTLTNQMIGQIDELTHSYGSSFDCDKASLCNSAWRLIQQSLKFWENLSLLITQSNYDETKLQTYVLIQRRIKNNWYFQSQQVKLNMKNYLCTQAQSFSNANGTMTKTQLGLYKKVNQIIVEILKYDWMGSWANFLNDICEAIFDNSSFAQNYFDLLSHIFSELFCENQKLTSEQHKKIEDCIIQNYNKIILKTFEKYLVSQWPVATLRNCICTLQQLLQWIPSYYIYFGLIIDKLILLLEYQNKNEPNTGKQNGKPGHLKKHANGEKDKSEDIRIQALTCLSDIILLPVDKQQLQNYIVKIYKKKRQIIISILNNDKLKQNRIAINKVLFTSSKFLEAQKSQSKKIYNDSSFDQENEEMLMKLVDWLNSKASNQHDAEQMPEQELQQYQIGLYKHIITVASQENQENILDSILKLTPCPIGIQFYASEKIIKQNHQNYHEDDYQQNRDSFTEIMSNLVKNHQEEYFQYLIRKLDQNYDPERKMIKKLCKTLWNFHYFISVACQQSRTKQKIMTVLNRLLSIQQHHRQAMPRNPKQLTVISQYSKCLKIGTRLILFHKKCLNIDILYQPILLYVQKGFLQDNNFLKATIEIISISYDYVPNEMKIRIDNEYAKNMANRVNRIEIDEKYILLLSKWASNKKENLQLGLSMINNLLEVYNAPVLYMNSLRFDPRNQQQINQIKIKTFGYILEWLKLVSIVVPYLKNSIFDSIQQILAIVKQFIAVIDFSGSHAQSIQFFRLSSDILIKRLSLPAIGNSKAPNNTAQPNQIFTFILSRLGNAATMKNINQQILQQMLKYLSEFINAFSNWPVDQALQISTINRTINVVYNCKFTHDVLGFSQFVLSVVGCSKFGCLQVGLISATIHNIFILASFQSEQKTLKAIEMLKTLITTSIDSPQGRQVLGNFILDTISYIFVIMIRAKESNFQYIKQYSDVLHMYLLFVRNMKCKISHEQQEDNIQQFIKIAKQIARKHYSYNEYFMGKIDNFLNFLIPLTSKQEFSEKCRDLVILLKRGY